jgi:hypothetical protein
MRTFLVCPKRFDFDDEIDIATEHEMDYPMVEGDLRL